MIIRMHITISGLVQGIGFRNYVVHKAKKLGVTGWVMNKTNGKVEVVVEGEETNVNQLVEACKKGPLLAKVDNVENFQERPEGTFKDFSVRY